MSTSEPHRNGARARASFGGSPSVIDVTRPGVLVRLPAIGFGAPPLGPFLTSDNGMVSNVSRNATVGVRQAWGVPSSDTVSIASASRGKGGRTRRGANHLCRGWCCGHSEVVATPWAANATSWRHHPRSMEKTIGGERRLAMATATNLRSLRSRVARAGSTGISANVSGSA